MANYYGSSRTNYFKVKDEVAFRAMVTKCGFETVEEQGKFALFPGKYSEGGFSYFDEDQDDNIELQDLVIPHLPDDEVVVVMEAGAEKLRYVVGLAYAFDNKGKVVVLSLDKIYSMAAKKWPKGSITRAEY